MCENPFPDIVELPLEDVLDLHSFSPKEIKTLVKEYLQDAYEAGFTEVRIIHGKGIGVQREIVRAAATRDPHVQSVSRAPEGDGSWGATIIRFYSYNHKKADFLNEKSAFLTREQAPGF